jgi:toxin ParE1/3/4
VTGIRLTAAAERQLEELVQHSVSEYGFDAASRYLSLFFTAVNAIGDEPALAGSTAVPGLAGVRSYSLRGARMRTTRDHRVGNPRHVVVYRTAADGVIEILGLVHDRMMLARHARAMIARADAPG